MSKSDTPQHKRLAMGESAGFKKGGAVKAPAKKMPMMKKGGKVKGKSNEDC